MKIDPIVVADYGKKVMAWLLLAEKKVEDFFVAVDNLFPDVTVNVVNEDVTETLSNEIFFGIIKKHAVAGANGMAVIYKKNADDDIFYLASVKDKELIDEKNNKFVVVKATDGVKKEVKEMFSSALETDFGKLIIIR
ncbi:MAG: hypothetical protein MJZ19_10165 [Paludibacteraceae bacterium]|nr:hypothetical protein [Paludibacteraceae bacterium]